MAKAVGDGPGHEGQWAQEVEAHACKPQLNTKTPPIASTTGLMLPCFISCTYDGMLTRSLMREAHAR